MAGTGETSIKSYNFFLDTTIQGAGTYANNGPHEFIDTPTGVNFLSHTIQLLNDSAANAIWFSFDGVNDYGRVLATEKFTQDFRRMKRIWFRGTAGEPFRFFAY